MKIFENCLEEFGTTILCPVSGQIDSGCWKHNCKDCCNLGNAIIKCGSAIKQIRYIHIEFVIVI
jgi:hypothetical protein